MAQSSNLDCCLTLPTFFLPRASLSKKELEECCIERGLGKKGSKDELVTKLIMFHQDLATKLEADPELLARAKLQAEKDAAKDSDDEASEDDVDESVDSDEDDEKGRQARTM